MLTHMVFDGADPGTQAAMRGVGAASDYLDRIDHSLDTTFLCEPSYAHFHVTYLGAMRLIQLDASPRRSERTTALIARDRHDGISIQLALAGTSKGRAGGKAVSSDPGSIMILDFSKPFFMVDLEPRTVINISIPRAVLEPRVSDLRPLHGEVIRPTMADLLAANMRALARQSIAPTAQAVSTFGAILVDLLLLALDRNPDSAAAASPNRHATLLEQATRIVDGRLGSSDLTPERLIAQLNVSRSDLYAAFESFGGVARFIWRRRLETAHAALVNANDQRRISEIAFCYGFLSEAHFSRAFRRMFGRTATAVRRAAQAADDLNH